MRRLTRDGASMSKNTAGPQTPGTFRSPSEALRGCSDLGKEHLPVECPECGANGLLRIDHLDRNFVCKQCNKAFHVTTSGLIPGKRPAEPAVSADGIAPYRKTRPAKKSSEGLWSSIPQGVKILLASGLAIAALMLIGNFVYSRFRSAATVPATLLERATYVGRAYARNDLHALELLVAPEMKQEARGWLAETRPAAWSGVSADAVVKVATPKLNVKRNLATSTVTIEVSGISGQLTTTLYWLPASPDSVRSPWLLDAKNTRRIAGKKNLLLRNADSE